MGKTSKKFNLCMYILRTEKQGGSKLMFMPFDIVSICVWLDVTDEYLEKFFVCFSTLLRM